MPNPERVTMPAPDLNGFRNPVEGAQTFWAEADLSNFWRAGMGYGGQTNEPVAIVLHTPEERADAIESTVWWFQQLQANASTHYYMDNDGDVYQMVGDRDMAWAQGVRFGGLNPNARLPLPSWHRPEKVSYNTQAISIEIEGFASSIGRTMPIEGPQYKGLVALVAYKALQYKIPVTREYIVAHSELATDRWDPGASFPWEAFMLDVKDIADGTINESEDHYHGYTVDIEAFRNRLSYTSEQIIPVKDDE